MVGQGEETLRARDEVIPNRMFAWEQFRYGGPDVLKWRQVEVGTPSRKEVLVKISATGLNAGDIRVMRGTPLLIRLFFGMRAPRERIRGMDVCGDIVAVGPEVTRFAVGDTVVGELGGGGLGEYVLASQEKVTHLVTGVSRVQAAALPIAGGTAWQALDSAKVTAGAKVLVLGASGGVGSFTVQLAAHRGAQVWALCGERNKEFVHSLGASKVFDYRATQLAGEKSDLPAGYFDAIIDVVGSHALNDIQNLLAPKGVAVLVAGVGSDVLGPIPRGVQAMLLSLGRQRKFHQLMAAPRTDITRQLMELVAKGSIQVPLEKTWDVTSADKAVAHVDAGHTVGKVVVVHDAGRVG